MKILFIDSAHSLLQKLLEEANYSCTDGSTQSREEILRNINEYSGIIIRSRIKIDKEFLDIAGNLKFIARAGAGMEGIDTSYAERRGIVCINSPEGSRDAVAEHTIAMLLSLFNNLSKADREVREGKWIREANRGTELHGKTVGILGYGNMGSSFAKKLSGFECNVIAFDKYKKSFSDGYVTETTLEKFFEEADVVSLHVPLSEETKFMVNNDFISSFRKNIYIINTARGKILKTDDLVRNMQNGKVLGACLDTLEYEDTSFEQILKSSISTISKPDSWNYLIQSDKVIFSPHIAGWTYESNEKIAMVLFDKIKRLFPV
jgi:D-3-phosphoglycerate dehydrogenase